MVNVDGLSLRLVPQFSDSQSKNKSGLNILIDSTKVSRQVSQTKSLILHQKLVCYSRHITQSLFVPSYSLAGRNTLN